MLSKTIEATGTAVGRVSDVGTNQLRTSELTRRKRTHSTGIVGEKRTVGGGCLALANPRRQWKNRRTPDHNQLHLIWAVQLPEKWNEEKLPEDANMAEAW